MNIIRIIQALARKNVALRNNKTGITSIPNRMNAEGEAGSIGAQLQDAGLSLEQADKIIKSEQDLVRVLNQINQPPIQQQNIDNVIKFPEGGIDSIPVNKQFGDNKSLDEFTRSENIYEQSMKPKAERFKDNRLLKFLDFDGIEAMKEANKVIKREGMYKNLSEDKSKSILDMLDSIIKKSDDTDLMAEGGRIGYGAGGITKVYQLLRGVNKTKPLRGLEEKLIKQYKSEGMEFIEAIKKAQTQAGGIRYESQMKIIDDAMKDTNVYSDDYVDLLDMKIKLEDPDFGKQFNKFPETVKNKTRSRTDPEWAEANFGENYSEQMDITRSKEINESIDPNFKEPLSPSDQMASDIDDMNTANVDDFFGTRKKNAVGGLAYMLGEEPRSEYSGGGSAGAPPVTYGPPVQKQTQVAGNSMYQQLIKEAQELEILKKKAQGNFREEPGNMNLPPMGGLQAIADRPTGSFEGNTLSDFGQAIGDITAPPLGVGYLNTGKNYEAGIQAYPNKINMGFRKQFAGGGLSRRAFLKLLGAGTATAAAAKTGILGLLKGKKVVDAIEIVTPTLTKAPGMPDWFPGLVKRIYTEGKDVSETAAEVERQIVKRVEIKGTSVDVTHNLDTGEVGVRVHSKVSDNMLGPNQKLYQDTIKSGDLVTAYDDGLEMVYTPSKLIDDGLAKGKKEPAKFNMSEAAAEYHGNPNDPEILAQGVNTELNIAKSDLKSLELYSKNKNPSIKDKFKIDKKNKQTRQYTDEPQSSPEIENLPNESDYGDIDGYASGGLAGLLGEPGYEEGGRVAFNLGSTPESQIEKIIIDLYTNEKLGAQAISKRLKDDYGITLTRAPVGRRITKLVKEGAMEKITTKAFNISQRGDQYGKIKNNYRIVRPITDANRLQNSNLPADANFKVQVSRNGKVEQLYTKTKAEADNAVRDTTIKPVDSKPGKDKRAKTRRDRVKEVTKGSSEADKTNIRTIEGGKKKLNLYFKNNPELINNSNFGKNIKAMLALRLDKGTGKVYSKIQDNSYYLEKAKQGQLFDLFDVNPVESGKRGGRYATNVSIAPSTFNRAFAGAQLTNFFKKGINKDTTRSLDNLFKKYNLRLNLPNVGTIGAPPGVAYDSKKGTFPTIDKTLKNLKAPKEVRDFFIQKNKFKKLGKKGALVAAALSAPSALKAADGTQTVDSFPTKTTAGAALAAGAIGTKTGRNILGRTIGAALGPTGILSVAAGTGGYDLKNPIDRLGIGVEAAFAPELVKGTIGATKGMKNRASQKIVQKFLNLGMKVPTALKAARVASPLGLGLMAGEGVYQYGKFVKNEIDRIKNMTPEERENYNAAEQEQMSISAKDGGIIKILKK